MKSGTPLKILSFGLAFLCLSSVWAAEGISAGHPNMPEFAPAPIEALITYIRSLDG